MHQTVRGYSEHLVSKVCFFKRVRGYPVATDSNQNEAASSSQVWQKDAERDESARRLVATATTQDFLNFRESSERLMAFMAEKSESIDGNDTVWSHNFHISTVHVPHLEEVFSKVRQIFGRKLGDKMEDLDVNTSICPPLFKPQFILETIIMWRI